MMQHPNKIPTNDKMRQRQQQKQQQQAQRQMQAQQHENGHRLTFALDFNGKDGKE